MKDLKKLVNEQSKIIEELEELNIKTTKQKHALDGISTQISEIKEQQDYGSFRFVHSNLPKVIQAIAPKHKVPKPRDIELTSTSMTASVPWADEECSDENPCNINVCDRCTVLHFHRVMEKLLSSYYAK